MRAATVNVANRKIQNPASLKCPPGLSLSLTLTIKHLRVMDVILLNSATDIGVYGSPMLKFDSPGQHGQGPYTSFSKLLDKLVAGWWYTLWLGCPRAWWLQWSVGRCGSSAEAVGVHGGGIGSKEFSRCCNPGTAMHKSPYIWWRHQGPCSYCTAPQPWSWREPLNTYKHISPSAVSPRVLRTNNAGIW